MILSTNSEIKINPWILMVLYMGLLAPFALNFHLHYPDEIYYRDAAVKMLQNGDYLTTYLGSGELRFKKPILTYWTVLAGFKLFGVNEFGSRIFFLLAGAATVGLTFLLAKILFSNSKIAGLSSLIMAANPVLIMSSARSIPDVLLVLTITISAIGFAGLLRDGEKAHQKYLWFLYLGLALAFEVKGLSAVGLGILGIGIVLFNPWKKVSWKKLFHIPALAVSLFIALFWFVAMWKIHGPTYLNSFFEDQIGIRFTSRIVLILQNGLLATFLLGIIFLPWSVLILGQFKNTVKLLWKENPQFFMFFLFWGLAILIIGGLTSKFYERYLLPVAPVLAVWIAWFLVRGGILDRIRGFKIAVGIFLSLLLILTSLSIWINLGEQGTGWLRLQWIIGVLFLIYAAIVWIRTPKKLPKIITYSILMLFFLLSSITYHFSFPHQGQQAKKRIDALAVSRPIGFAGNLNVGSKIRMSLGPNYELIDLPRENWISKTQNYSVLILEDKRLNEMDLAEYEVQVLSKNWDSSSLVPLLSAYHSASFDSLLDQMSSKYYLLIKK